MSKMIMSYVTMKIFYCNALKTIVSMNKYFEEHEIALLSYAVKNT